VVPAPSEFAPDSSGMAEVAAGAGSNDSCTGHARVNPPTPPRPTGAEACEAAASACIPCGPVACEERLRVALGLPTADAATIATLGSTSEGCAAVERAIAHRALSDRLSSASALAAGIAHELNNPLAYVSANLSFLAERTTRVVEILSGAAPTPDDADLAVQLHEAMREARSGAERMRTVVRDLKTFARGDDERRVPVDLRPVLDSCVNVAWSEISRRARLARDLEAVAPVLGDEARLSHLFLNLLLNAAQAIPEGRPDDHELGIATRTLPDGRISVVIRDTGAGIAPEHLPRIFDPFFTTKAPGVGTGLGLSICHAVVAAMGGEIQVESAVGRGSTFRVLLAPADRPVEIAEPRTRPPEPGRARVLVVDDEPLVGTVLRRTLGDHDVTVVESARAALDRLSAGERYDVILSDLLMPGMSGMDLFHELSGLDPSHARRMVFLTGGAFTAAAREFLDRERVECLEKPFELEVLRAIVARHLAVS